MCIVPAVNVEMYMVFFSSFMLQIFLFLFLYLSYKININHKKSIVFMAIRLKMALETGPAVLRAFK
ncbi:hypothetical protein DYE50_11500 [Treponema ruminis]|nr:hypothetical protein DYE50_11500 [Treponema ruminis]